VLSLGCQHVQLEDFRQELLRRNPGFNKPLFTFEQQKSQSEESLIAQAIKQTFVGLVEVNRQTRQPAPLSKLVLGVKCGGSDGFSGISANPAVGYAADLLVALGGSVLLAEFPELCGVEQELADRCVDGDVAAKFVRLMKTYAAQAEAAGSGFHANPSPGNIRDGLITDAIKSAGAAKKGGTSPIVDVLDYTEPVRKPGLSLVCTPATTWKQLRAKPVRAPPSSCLPPAWVRRRAIPFAPSSRFPPTPPWPGAWPTSSTSTPATSLPGKPAIRKQGGGNSEYCIRRGQRGRVSQVRLQLAGWTSIPWKRGVSCVWNTSHL
jgi:altronate hydrolase